MSDKLSKKVANAQVKKILDRVEAAKGKATKVGHATELMEFLCDFGHELLAVADFHKASVGKALEFKKGHDEFPLLVAACERFLATWAPDAEAEQAAAERWERLCCPT